MANLRTPSLRFAALGATWLAGVMLASCKSDPIEPPKPPTAPQPQLFVRLNMTGAFGEPETLAMAQTDLDSLCAIHPYLTPETLAVLPPDTAWVRNLRAGEGRYGEGQCEVCEDGFFEVAALSLSRRHVDLDGRRIALQGAMNEVNQMFQCLDGGGTHHMHMVARIPFLAERALVDGIRSGFTITKSVSKKSLEARVLRARQGLADDPEEPQTSPAHCLEGFPERFPDDPWILEQTAKVLERF